MQSRKTSRPFMSLCRSDAHKDAVSRFDRYAKGGGDAKLKAWAGRMLPALQHHLDMAQDMDKNCK